VSARIEPARQPLENEIAREIVAPESVEEIAEIVRKCEADRITLAPLGAARTLSQIRNAPVQIGISLAHMSKIVAYEPEDMTVVAEAGITLGDLNATMGTRNQRLPIDPRDPEAATLGALIGAAHAGPLRLSEGTVRDLLIGIQFVGHGGHIIRAGGRVVKNVAGYDLMKVMTGSFGTLGIVTEATFKVRPIPENYTIARSSFANGGDAFAAASKLHDQLSLIHLEVLSRSVGAAICHEDRFIVMAGFAGIHSELKHQRDRIASILGPSTEIVEGDAAREIYRELRDLQFSENSIVARMALLPAELARCVAESRAEYVAHVGSGIAELWAHGGDSREIVARWREIAHSARGHLRVVSAPVAMRSQIEFFDQPNPGAFKLMQRLKTTFDPAGIFNPDCFVGAL
jgi:glycolate oxidase FAD binding subunit